VAEPDVDVATLPEPEAGGAEEPAGELFLVDGNSLAYRAFFALPESISTSEGFPTNALYGFAAMMMKVLAEERPGRVVVCWDAPGRTFRHDEFPDYKAGRRETPDLMREQSPHFRPMMERFGFVNTELPGYEADDIIGTLARRAEEAGERVTILTGDRDTFQLVSDLVSVLATGRGVTDTVRYTPERVMERYGIPPDLMTDFRGLVGDTTDNLPGVPGIGEKGASQLLQKYGGLEGVLEHAAEQTPKRREALGAHADDARRSRDLAVIRTDAPVELDLDDVPALVLDDARAAELSELFRRFEFSSLARRLPEILEGAPPPAPPPAATRRVRAVPAAPEALALRLAGAERVALAVADGRWAVTDGGEEVLTGAWDEEARQGLVQGLRSIPVEGHDTKEVLRALPPDALEPAHDTMIAAYLLEPRRRSYPLDELAGEAGLGVEADEGEGHEAVVAAARVHDLAPRQRARLEAEGLQPLWRDIELPLVSVLADMEHVGVRIDAHRLGEIAHRVRERADELRDRIWELAGGEFVIDSPKQLGQVLFERLGLPTFRRGKTGWSTDRQVLKLLEPKHPIVGLIGQYRELTKLDNTYLSALPGLVGPDGRLHTTFNQTVAETGRLSSTNPNLQNIPIRTPLGREIRSAFVAEDGWRLVSCDYSQVELRILAHVSGEPALREAFRRGDDIHRATAAEVFGMTPADVDRTVRDRAKAVNFGIVYGISDFGLSDQLGIPRAEARAYIDEYLARYPRVRSFIDTTIAAAVQEGYVTTLFGRRRPIPELAGRTVQQRQLGERLAVNTIIQGSAADIIKRAMVRAHEALRRAGGGARLVLQIHDELLLEAPADQVATASRLVSEAMVGAYDLEPPLTVDVGVGETWLEAK
jgi:DNA polymerase-1